MDMKKFEVPVEKLRWQCDPAIFDFRLYERYGPIA